MLLFAPDLIDSDVDAVAAAVVVVVAAVVVVAVVAFLQPSTLAPSWPH